MRSKGPRILHDSEGKGLIGCVIFIVLFAIAIFLAITLGPIYYSNYSFESELKTEASRAGSHFIDDETVMKDVLDLAKRNEIQLAREDIKLERFAGQLHITVHYAVPVDLLITRRNLNFDITASSFVGAL